MSILCRLKFIVPRKVLEYLYITTVRPVLEYGNIIYDNCSLQDSNLLDQIQRKAALICTKAYRHTSTERLYHELGWNSLKTRRKVHKFNIFYQIINRLTPNYLYNNIANILERERTHNTRGTGNLCRFKTRISSFYNSYFPCMARTWNTISLTIRNYITFPSFKLKLKYMYYCKRNPIY
jgi:hypothetical protein